MIRTHGRSRRSPLRAWSLQPLEGRTLLTQTFVPRNILPGVSADLGAWPPKLEGAAVAEYKLVFDSAGGYSSLVLLAMGDAGLWTWSDADGPTKINDRSPEAIVTTMAGGAYLDFGAAGLWSYDVDQGYRKLSDADPKMMIVIPTANSPTPQFATGVGPIWDGSKLVVDFGPAGLWALGQVDGDWRKLNDVSPDAMVANGHGLILDYGSRGVWTWESYLGGWAKINDVSPEAVVGGGYGEAYFDYGASGLWGFNGADWRQVSTADPRAIVGSQGFLYVDQGRDGLWMVDRDGRLEKLNDRAPRSLSATYGSVLVDFGDAGLWKYAPLDVRWDRVNGRSPGKVAVDGPSDGAVLDYGDAGLWRWDVKSGWRKIWIGFTA